MEHCQWSIKRKLWCKKWYIIYNTKLWKWNLFGTSYILVRADITIIEHAVTQIGNKNRWNNSKWCWKIRRGFRPMYNLLEYNSNYSGKTGKLLFYSKNEATNFNNIIKCSNSFWFFDQKTKLLESTEAQSTMKQWNSEKSNSCCTIRIPKKVL